MAEAFGRLGRRAVADIRATWAATIGPVAPAIVALADAEGAVLAEAVAAPGPLPPDGVALIDGLAVVAAETSGASPYAPVDVSVHLAVVAGARVPPPFDAVAPGDGAGIDSAVAPGTHLRRAGADAQAGAVLVPAGPPLGARALAVAATAGMTMVRVRRADVAIVAGVGGAAAAAFVGRLCVAYGARCQMLTGAAAIAPADLAIFVGGPAIGDTDAGYRTATAHSDWTAIGVVALCPGATAVAGFIGSMPALVLPARLDAGLAVFLALVVPLLDRLTARTASRPSQILPLARKVVSTIGISELALFAKTADDAAWQPLAVGEADLAALSHATAWALLPPESEGHDAATPFAAHLLPSSL